MSGQATCLLMKASRGDSLALDKLVPLVYDELRGLAASFMRAERPGHTLQPTALVNEVYLRLVDHDRVDWKGRTHFKAIAAMEMRRVLIDYARRRDAVKRGGGLGRISLTVAGSFLQGGTVDLVDIEDSIERFSKLDPRAAKVVELRVFGGLLEEEIAEAIGVSPRTVRDDWRMAKTWLRKEFEGGRRSQP